MDSGKVTCTKKIVFRTEGYDEIGLGHIYRCLAIADHTCDHEFIFVVSTQSSLGIRIIQDRFYPVVTFEPGIDRELQTILECKPEIVINDILDTSLDYMRKLKSAGYRVVNFEDLGKGAEFADAVINEMYDSAERISRRNVFSGTEYVCLRDEFFNLKPITIKDEIRNLLLLFGGTDPRACQLKYWIGR